MPINFKQARNFLNQYHSHHIAPQGWKFGVGVEENKKLIGVAIAGRPVSRLLDDGKTLEITRCCSNGSKKNIASMLYGSLVRAAKALGYQKCITYTLITEKGTSLLASNWEKVGIYGGGTWNRKTRKRKDKHPIEKKILWCIVFHVKEK